MKVILKQDIDTLGDAGDVVSIKDGYGRNYLLPRGMAAMATKGNLKRIDEEKRQIQAQQLRIQRSAEGEATKYNGVVLTFAVNVGEEDRMFGSVTSQNIADALEAKGLPVDKRKIRLEDPIKQLGVFAVDIKLHPKVTAQVQVNVTRQ